jgi:hypothetical protein
MTRATKPAWWLRTLGTLATVVAVLGIALVSLPVNAYLACRRYLLRREVRLEWGSRPRVIVRDEGPLWSRVLRERWLPSATVRTVVLGAFPAAVSPGEALSLEWRVYLEWGPDFKFCPPPVALIVHANGSVQRVPFEKAILELTRGNDGPMRAQLDELARLSCFP